MKDTQVKPSPTPPLLPKSQIGILKGKMAAKKGKEHKTPIMKVGRGKKLSNVNKRTKINKDNVEPTIKRKRGRPRNEDRLHIKKPVKEQKCVKKNEGKTVGRKRKLNINADVKIEKEFVSPPFKKTKLNENCNNVNGDIKMSHTSNHKSLVEKEKPPAVELTAPHAINSNGTLNSKKTLTFGTKKAPFNILKSATFLPPPKKELLNGNSNLASCKFQAIKNKSSCKKDSEAIFFPKDSEINSRVEKINNVISQTKQPNESVANELSKFHNSLKFNLKEPFKPIFKESFKCFSKDPPKFHSEDQVKNQIKEPVKSTLKELTKSPVKEAIKSQAKEQTKPQAKEPVKSTLKEFIKPPMKEPIKSQAKEQTKPQTKEPVKSSLKEFTKPPVKEPIKSQAKEQTKPQTKEPVKSTLKELAKLAAKEPIKSQTKEQTKPQTKEPVKSSPKETSKPLSKETVKSPPIKPLKPLPKEPVKLHPHRMASLDALARMHVICTTDRKPPEPKHTSGTFPRPFSQKSITKCHERIQVDVKKETNDSKGNVVHKQEINFVKEKQEVFVSHSLEQSSVVEHEQSKTVSTKVQHETENKKSKLSEKPSVNKQSKNKLKQSPSIHSKSVEILPKVDKSKPKVSKNKDGDKKSAKVQSKAIAKLAKTVKEKQDTKGMCKKTKKVEQTKSEVKVKETIRMQKTCTYQSVTTVNSHSSANSSVVPVSHVGMTTNISKTKKTVVTDDVECKNKVNYSSGSVINNSYCLTTESPISVGPHTDCCKLHTHSQIIPFAHMQTCSLGHSLNRTSDASSSHCDGSFSMHRFSHQQPVIFSPPAPSECGFCCSSSLVQKVHDSCLLHKSIVTFPHHLPSHHTHLSSTGCSSEAVCSEFHPSNATLDTQRHHTQHFTVSSPSTHSRVTCCACCKHQRDSNQHHHQSSLQYLPEPKTSSSIVPCEQTPLDLSLTSTSPNISIESDIPLQQAHCSSPICCSRDILLLRTSPHSFQHKFACSKPLCRCSKQIVCETQAIDTVQSLSCANKSIIKISEPQTVNHHISLLASPASQGPVHPVAATSGITNKSEPGVITEDSLVTAKCEKSISPKQSSKLSLIPKKRIFAHGWSWKGKPREKLIALTNDSIPCPRVCYPSVQHKEGDTISERDCVLLRSGPKDTDLPYVAKVAAFWENPEDGEMMMSLLWYYRPEHTDQGRKPGQMEDEVFASRHKDANSVACIEDKCYVLTYNEYCRYSSFDRYKASLSMEEDMVSLSSMMVPELPDGYSRRSRLPCELVAQDIVFFCRHVYDFRQKRILKNPT